VREQTACSSDLGYAAIDEYLAGRDEAAVVGGQESDGLRNLLNVRDIARRIGVAPSNIQRLINTLTKAGFLEQSESNGRYKIGHRAFRGVSRG
jgi:Fic family protein